MAMARGSRATGNLLSRFAKACSSYIAACPSLHPSSHPVLPASPLLPVIRPFSSSTVVRSWRSSSTPCTAPCGMSLIVRDSTSTNGPPSLPSIYVRAYSKRPKKWQGGRYECNAPVCYCYCSRYCCILTRLWCAFCTTCGPLSISFQGESMRLRNPQTSCC